MGNNNMEYETTARKVYTAKAPVRTRIQVQDGEKIQRKLERKNLRRTLKQHKQAIKRLRGDVKRHKLQMKQAKLTYKLSK